MTTSNSALLTLPTDTQILITREFDAPRHLVWQAYTTPDLITRWWAGQRGDVTSAKVDLRVGGAWRYVMTANGGFEVAFHGVFREIEAPDRLVMTEVFEADGITDDDAAVNTVTFTEVDGRTTLTLLTQVATREVRDMIIASGMEGGMQEGMDALEQVAISLGSSVA